MYEVYLRVSHLFPEYLDGQSQTKPAAVSLHTPRRQGGGESLHLITANNQEHVSIYTLIHNICMVNNIMNIKNKLATLLTCVTVVSPVGRVTCTYISERGISA